MSKFSISNETTRKSIFQLDSRFEFDAPKYIAFTQDDNSDEDFSEYNKY
jgi:hypothetical protein